MKCAVLTVGTEIIHGFVTDTNSSFISRELYRNGIECCFHLSAPDDLDKIVSAIEEALKWCDALIITGGLGPTADDLTRQAISKAARKKLVFTEEIAELIRKHFKKYNENMLLQAYLPKGAILFSPPGRAPGFVLEYDEKLIFALPGVPKEVKPLLKNYVLPFLGQKSPEKIEIYTSKILKIKGLEETSLETKIKEILSKIDYLSFGILPYLGEVHLYIIAKAKTKKEAVHIRKLAEKKLRQKLGDFVYGEDEETLEEVIGKLLNRKGLKLAVVESCTGGLLGNRITNVPGSSTYFCGGFITYSNTLKQLLVEVPEELLRRHGAVSREVAIAMARGARDKTQVDMAISITGISGPGGATPEKPAGLSYIALSTKKDTICYHYKFRGTRESIKFQATQEALDLLRKYLLKEL